MFTLSEQEWVRMSTISLGSSTKLSILEIEFEMRSRTEEGRDCAGVTPTWGSQCDITSWGRSECTVSTQWVHSECTVQFHGKLWDLYCTCAVAQLAKGHDFMSPPPPHLAHCAVCPCSVGSDHFSQNCTCSAVRPGCSGMRWECPQILITGNWTLWGLSMVRTHVLTRHTHPKMGRRSTDLVLSYNNG